MARILRMARMEGGAGFRRIGWCIPGSGAGILTIKS